MSLPVYLSIIENNISIDDIVKLNNHTLSKSNKYDVDLHNRLIAQPKVYLGHAAFDLAEHGKIGAHISRTINRIVRLLNNSYISINEKFISDITEAFRHENKSLYPIGNKDLVVGFLESHINKECFLIFGGPENSSE